jgi:hypothetical protein
MSNEGTGTGVGIDKSDTESGMPYWTNLRKWYKIIWPDKKESIVKLSEQAEAGYKESGAKCSHCGCPKTETGWTVVHIPDEQGGGYNHICPQCNRVTESKIN